MVDITTKEIFTELAKYPRDESIQDIIDENNQFFYQSKAITNFNQCNSTNPYKDNILDELQLHLGSLDKQSLLNDIYNKFYDIKVMEGISCILNSIKYSDQMSGVIASERIKHYYTNGQTIGQKSLNGVVMESDFDTIKDLIVIKLSKNLNGTQDNILINELYNGLFGLNPLRKDIPNFAYTYGGFVCSEAYVGSDEKLITWCNNNNPIDYILLENIKPSITLSEYVKSCSFEDFLFIYLQILYALSYAKRTVDFTHYDLHGTNVLIRTMNSNKFYIKYVDDRGDNIYLPSNKIAIIIDFGYSHIEINSKNTGIYGINKYGIKPEVSFPMYDAYKLLGFCLLDVDKIFIKSENNRQCIEGMYRILKFFNKSDTYQNILNQNKTLFSLPHLPKLLSITHQNLIDYIIKEFNLSLNVYDPNDKVKIYGQEKKYHDVHQVFDELKLTKEIVINNNFEFYDVVSHLTNEGKNDEVAKAIKGYNYKKEIEKDSINFINGVEQLIKDIVFLTKNKIVVFGMPEQKIFIQDFEHKYHIYVDKIMKVLNDYESLIFLQKVIYYVMNYYRYFNIDLQPIIVGLNEYYKSFKLLIIQLDKDIRYIRRFLKDSDYKKFPWYFDLYDNLKSLTYFYNK